MRILKPVKAALLTSLLFLAGSEGARAFSLSPQMPCGIYHVQGRLTFNRQGQSILRMQEHTSSPFELILYGGDVQQLLLYRELVLAAEVSVPHPIQDNRLPIVIFKKWLAKGLPADQAVQQVRTATCEPSR